MPLRPRAHLLGASLFATLASGCGRGDPPAGGAPSPVTASAELQTPAQIGASAEVRPDGATLAQKYCSTCHLPPSREALPRPVWPGLLDVMGAYLGHDPRGLARRAATDPQGRFLDPRRVPAVPLLDAPAWARLRTWYEAVPPPPLPAPDPPGTPLSGFEAFTLPSDVLAPIVSLVRIDPARHGLWVGEGRSSTLRRLDAAGVERARFAVPSPPIDLRRDPHGLEVALIGDFAPSDARRASVVRLDERAPNQPPAVVLRDLQRATASVAVDLDGDRDDDRIVCEFGDFSGQLAWWERRPDGFHPHVLLARAGALAARVHDADADGRPDVLALVAQGREGLYLFRNEGGGRFTERTLIEQPPTFGYTDLHLADLDGDRRPEVVTVNGDNGDLQGAPLRPDHGVRVYALEGEGPPRLLSFLPLHGAYRTAPADLDGDGDVDLPVVSFFPDLRTPDPAFVVFENLGGLRFQRRTHPAGGQGRWLTLDAGDLEGDGDVDLVLGAAYPDAVLPAPGQPIDPRLARLPGAVVLRNTRAGK